MRLRMSKIVDMRVAGTIRALILLCAGAIGSALGSASDQNANEMHDDHLVPVQYRAGGELEVYDKLCRAKLFLTTGDTARLLEQVGSRVPEIAVSIYRDTTKAHSLPGGYWLTLTQPSVSLWDVVENKSGPLVESQSVKILRLDVPMPESTALAVHKLWVVMLKQAKPLPKGKYGIGLDCAMETFSATNSDGKSFEAEVPCIDLKTKSSNTRRLIEIGRNFISYFNIPVHERPELARKIENAADALLRDVSQESGRVD